MLIFQICCHVFFLPTIPKGHFSECAVTAIFPETLLFQQWAEDDGFFSYSGMGEVFVLRCILNPTKNYTLLRKRIHIRIVQPKKTLWRSWLFFPFRILDIFVVSLKDIQKLGGGVKQMFLIFILWGKGIQVDERAYVSNGLVKNHQLYKYRVHISIYRGYNPSYPYFRQFWRVEVLVCLHLGSCILVKNHQLEKWHNRRLSPRTPPVDPPEGLSLFSWWFFLKNGFDPIVNHQ